ncbi:MFS transporter [Bifidobacterium sp. ESL0704]|uniref:MFS transporter n=1 Tax=Bifidobacterium sp. ESL0704 TaxID=2983219 RepID=UPI0023F93A27|nr:MFS transporter [Bifidobacterium sp. ESL0704]WEV53548.1 MFS transporter [Bifidobacterium sp. ESL0704]
MTSEDRGYSLLIAVVVTGMTTYMLYPLLTVQLLKLGFSAADAGLILGVLSGVGPLCSSLCGTVTSKIGAKPVAVAGLALRACGLAVFATNATLPMYLLCSAAASLGSSSASLAVKTELMRRATSRRMVTLRSMAVNSGALVGPAIGAGLFALLGFRRLVLVSIALYALLALLMILLRFSPPEDEQANVASEDVSAGRDEREQGWKKLFSRDSAFPILLALTFIYWTVYAQWSLVVPIGSYAGFHTQTASNAIYMGNAVFILILQYPLLVHALGKVKDTTILLLGFASFVVAFGALLAPSGAPQIVAFAVAFSLSELLISPTLDLLTGRIRVAGSMLSRAYGWTGTFSGVASLVGSWLGGCLIDVCRGISGVPLFCLPLVACALLLIVLFKKKEPSL